MKLLHVHSLPLKDVIIDLAALFKVDYTRNCGEYSVKIPSTWGTGSIKGINFQGGLGLLIYDCNFNTDVEIHFTVNDIHPLKFLYCLQGKISHHFENHTDEHPLSNYQNIIVASKGNDGHVLKFLKNEQTEIYSLEINRKLFKSKMACELGKAKPNLQEIFNDDLGDKSFYYNGLYSLNLAEIFEEMKNTNFDHLIGKIFSESQSFRMLTQQLTQFDDDSNEDADRIILRKAEVSAILEAVEIFKAELDMLGSISSIANRVGLSGNKFQNGFKTLYGKTANEYIQFLKLSLAKDLLVNTHDSIQEIKYKIGFNSHSYFSQLFKKMYGVNPSIYRQNYLENKKMNRSQKDDK
uniref:helix-turn-helix domain-containing protein n=1 Tax=Mariniflexile sp. TaxID=1979402 RepID=UPI0040474A53